MAEFEGLDPNSERDEIRDIISALSQGNAGEEKLEKDISSIKKNVDVIVSNTMSGPSKEEREENARQEKNNARFLADLLAQKLAGIFGEQLKKLKEIAENTKPLTEEGGFKLPERTGKRDNEDGSYSTHIMRHETADGINWFAFPTLFQNEDGSWDDRSEQANKDWRSVAAEAERRGEVIHFGTDRDAAAKYAKTLGGTKQKGGYRLDNNYADNYIKDYLRKKGGYKWDLEKLKDFNKK